MNTIMERGNSSTATVGVSLVQMLKNTLDVVQPYPDSAGLDEEHRDIEFKAQKWAVFGNTYSPCEQAVDTLPPGHYVVDMSPSRGIFFTQKTVSTDKLLELPDTASNDVIKGIENFWTREEHYRKFNFIWKRGILLTGPPGSGKTSTVQIVIKKVIERGGLVFYVRNPTIICQGLEVFRHIEPKRQILVVMEDLDAIIAQYNDPEILALLDGELQIDNVVFIATTNYPEKLDQRIKNRPSRFDVLKVIGMPSLAARKMFLELKNDRLRTDAGQLDRWVKETDGFSIAHLKELIISVECLDIPFDEAMVRLKHMIQEDLRADSEERVKLGFLNN